MLKYFRFSLFFTVFCLALAAYWGFTHGVNAGFTAMCQVLLITMILAVMEVSLSFDNAVVNATVLKHWNPYWKKLFLTAGVLVAVFGMRLLFPLLIVSVTSNLGIIEVAQLALNHPIEYSQRLAAHHAEVVAFGGMFLFLVFLNFIFDEQKDTHWFKHVELFLSRFGQVPAIEVFIALVGLVIMASAVSEAQQFAVTMAGIWGIIVYIGVQVIGHLLESRQADDEAEQQNGAAEVPKAIMKGGIAGFIYLELLDASFSFDGVLGAFAVTNDVVTIMLGLAIGAMFVRSLTVYLVDQGTLDAYIYLEHGAHYAIGALAIIMLGTATGWHVPEVVTGLIGIFFIVWAVFSSIAHNKKQC